eukprot:2559771-Amphidinium_carterae.1
MRRHKQPSIKATSAENNINTAEASRLRVLGTDRTQGTRRTTLSYSARIVLITSGPTAHNSSAVNKAP